MEEMLRLVNERRAQEGAPPLRLNTNLNKAAFDHSKDMGENNYFSHTGLDGSNFGERAISAGYQGSPRAENIAAGSATAKATFDQWESSSGHLGNMLNEEHNEMGIGHASINGSDYTHYWTQIFGKGNTLSVTDNTVTQHTRIYPNPFNDMLHISFSNKIQKTINIKIIAITGQTIYQQNTSLDTDLTLNLNYLPKGVYFLDIEDSKLQKIVKR